VDEKGDKKLTFLLYGMQVEEKGNLKFIYIKEGG
jgi:hypothetical protein